MRPDWKTLETISDLDEAVSRSFQHTVLLFKHSTRCSISTTAYDRLERGWNFSPATELYYLDLLNHRDISAAIAERFNVQHESPQILIIKNGECVFHTSHTGIRIAAIEPFVGV